MERGIPVPGCSRRVLTRPCLVAGQCQSQKDSKGDAAVSRGVVQPGADEPWVFVCVCGDSWSAGAAVHSRVGVSAYAAVSAPCRVRDRERAEGVMNWTRLRIPGRCGNCKATIPAGAVAQVWASC